VPSIVVVIEWDKPDEPFWLNADNVAIALHAYCENTKFQVCEVDSPASEPAGTPAE